MRTQGVATTSVPHSVFLYLTFESSLLTKNHLPRLRVRFRTRAPRLASHPPSPLARTRLHHWLAPAFTIGSHPPSHWLAPASPSGCTGFAIRFAPASPSGSHRLRHPVRIGFTIRSHRLRHPLRIGFAILFASASPSSSHRLHHPGRSASVSRLASASPSSSHPPSPSGSHWLHHPGSHRLHHPGRIGFTTRSHRLRHPLRIGFAILLAPAFTIPVASASVSRFASASPPDVRRWLCLAEPALFEMGLRPSFGLWPRRAEPEPRAQPITSLHYDGGAQPRLTSGGKAAAPDDNKPAAPKPVLTLILCATCPHLNAFAQPVLTHSLMPLRNLSSPIP
jgi:hypothetical protein